MHLFISIIIVFSAYIHPYYVSIFEVSHNRDTKTIQVAIKVFTTDLEQAIQAKSQKEYFLGKPNEHSEADSLITEYINYNFNLKTDGKSLTLNFVGKETELEAIWCYFESQTIEAPHKLEVTSTVFLELFDLQNNIIHTQVGGKKLSAILNKEHTQKTLYF